MKQYMKSTLAFGIALSMLDIQGAFAQQQSHDAGQHDQHAAAPQHPGMQSHSATQHQTVRDQSIQHQPMQHQSLQRPVVQHQNNQHQTMQRQQIEPQHRQMVNSSHHWQHGQHYNGDRRVVSNWQYYHLRQPPEGYEWVQDGSQFVLIAVASGIIADVIANALSQ